MLLSPRNHPYTADIMKTHTLKQTTTMTVVALVKSSNCKLSSMMTLPKVILSTLKAYEKYSQLS